MSAGPCSGPRVHDEEDIEAGDEDVELRLIVDVTSPKRILLTLGASLIGSTLLCSEVHNQTYLPQESKTVQRVEASGTPQELGRIAAAWFEEVLRRPVISPEGRSAWTFAVPGRALPDGFRWVRGKAFDVPG